MARLSPSLQIAFQITNYEAVRAGHPVIEPEHFLLGITSLDKVFNDEVRQQFEISDAMLTEIDTEWTPVKRALSTGGADVSTLRRAIRNYLQSRLQPGLALLKMPEITEISRQVLVQAGWLAEQGETERIRVQEFLTALMQVLQEKESPLLEQFKVIPAAGSATVASQKEILPPAAERQTEKSGNPEEPLEDGGLEGIARVKTQILERVDATRSAHPDGELLKEPARQLELLCDLPAQLEKEIRLDSVLQRFLNVMIGGIPTAARGAALLKGGLQDELLLKAHFPVGRPAIDLAAARQAMETKQGFISRVEASAERSGAGYAIYAPLLWKGNAIGVICLDSPAQPFQTDDLKLVLALAQHAALAVANLQLQEDLKRNTALLERLLTNFSPKLRRRLVERAQHGRLRPGGERSEVTILFSDIRNFTQIAANMDTEDVLEMLNDCFSVCAEAIFQFDGTIDKFVGDAILAVFGSPDPDPLQHENAVRAGLAMQSALADLNQQRSTRGQVPCNVGIGVHCGEVLHGFVGAAERLEFTVIGDAVNRASRYCAAAKGGEVLISPELYERVWRCVETSQRTIATKHEGPLTAYSINGLSQAAAPRHSA